MADVEVRTSAAPVDDAGALLASWLEAVHRDGRAPRLGVPGGSALAALPMMRAKLSRECWRRLKLTLVDERVVPHASADSNLGALRRSHVLDERPGLVLPLVEDGETGATACLRVAPLLAREFTDGLDVALLGLGEDGHVASLFPGHRALEAVAPVTWLADSPKPPPTRVTLTLPVLARTQTRRLVLAMGEGKRAALERLLAGDSTLPVTRLGPLTVVTDLALTRR